MKRGILFRFMDKMVIFPDFFQYLVMQFPGG